ncbi:MAG: thioredoxin domain-containing protein [Gemmatimonadota bacterium]
MHHPRFRTITLGVVVAGSLAAGACTRDTAPRRAAADVSADDVRRLPPGRAALTPDIMLGASDKGRSLGPDSAPVRLYVVSDFQCTACRTWFDSTLPVIRRDYTEAGTVRLLWVHYPLRDHPAAVRAASAAQCASASGQFWDASRQLFATQARWGTATVDSALIDSIATVPGMDAFTFRNCTQGNRMLRQIRGDIDFADARQVGSLPALVLGSRVLPADIPLPALRALLDSAIAAR